MSKSFLKSESLTSQIPPPLMEGEDESTLVNRTVYADFKDRRGHGTIQVIMHAEGFPYTPKEILALVRHGTPVDGCRSVRKITDDLVVKLFARPVEALTTKFVQENTGIPVPEVYMVFTETYANLTDETYIVSKFIQGACLREGWTKLCDREKQAVISQVASYIRQLRNIRPVPSKPGPLDPAAQFRGRYFTYYDVGPFESYDALVDWLNQKRRVCLRFGVGKQTVPFNTSYPLRFTHGDLCPRNLILDNRGTLWLVDWDWAGWYPAYFEYATIYGEADDCVSPTPDFETFKTAILAEIDGYATEALNLKTVNWAMISMPLVL